MKRRAGGALHLHLVWLQPVAIGFFGAANRASSETCVNPSLRPHTGKSQGTQMGDFFPDLERSRNPSLVAGF